MRRLIAILVLAACAVQARPKSLFYLGRDAAGVQSFLDHADRVDILVPTWYNVDAAGVVTGQANATVMEAAQQHRVPVMPIVVNP